MSKPDLSVIGGLGQIRVRPDLAPNGRAAAQYYEEMRDEDPLIGGFFYALESLFRRVTFTDNPAPKPEGPRGSWTEARAKFWALFLKQCREDMNHTFAAFLSEVLTELVYGFAPFEVVYKYRLGLDQTDPSRRSRYVDGRIGWRKLALRHQTSIDSWEQETDGGIQGFWQYLQGGQRVFIPIGKAVLFRTSEVGNNPEGRSLLRNARRPYRMRKFMEEVEAIGVDRDFSGIPSMQVPSEYLDPEADEATKRVLGAIVQQLESFRRDERSFMLVPAERETVQDRDGKYHEVATGFKFGLVTASGTRAHNTTEIIRRYTTQTATSLLSTFLLLGGDGKGALALSKDLTALFELAGTGVLDGIVETFNRFAVRPLMELNGVPPELWPELGHAGLSDEALNGFIATLNGLLNSGGVTWDRELENHVREQLSLPPKPEDAPDPPAKTTGGNDPNTPPEEAPADDPPEDP